MRLVAHRGFAAVEPENTVRAVRRAAGVADAVEVDVRRCGSGEPVVIHDETVDRVTDARGRVADLDRADLRSLSVLGSGEAIPALGDVVEAMPGDVELLVELKEPGLAADVAAAAAEGGSPLRLQAFDPAVVAEARAAAPAVPRSLLVDEDPLAGIERAVDLDCDRVAAHHRLCDDGFVARAHDAGLAVDAWTVADRERAAALASAGVDGLVSDAPDVLPSNDPQP